MDKQHLHQRLEELHKELQQVESVDDNDRPTLQKLMADIQDLLEHDEEESRYGGLLEGLREGIERFEASHPTATMLMGRVVDALAKMGI